jgi:hypothetical protein
MNTIPNNVLAFAGEANMSVYEKFQDYFRHYRAINGEKVSYNNELDFAAKEIKMNEALKAEIERVSGVSFSAGVNEAALASNPQVVWATFAVIGAMIDAILPETLIDSIGMYTDVRFGGFGDSFAFDVAPRDLFVVSKHGHAKRTAEVHKQFKGQVTIIPELREITTQVSLYKVLAGKESLADFVMRCVRSIETQMSIDCYKAFDAAMTNLPTTPVNGQLKATGYDQSTLVDFAQKVTAYNGGNKAVIVGTQLALQNVLPADGNYRYDVQSDYVKVGYIRTAFGYDLMVLPQVADWKEPFKMALDNNRIYIVSPGSQKLIKLCIEGSTLSNVDGTFANANLTQNATIMKLWGTGVATNAIAALIEIE